MADNCGILFRVVPFPDSLGAPGPSARSRSRDSSLLDVVIDVDLGEFLIGLLEAGTRGVFGPSLRSGICSTAYARGMKISIERNNG